jgi:hypothetical protein
MPGVKLQRNERRWRCAVILSEVQLARETLVAAVESRLDAGQKGSHLGTNRVHAAIWLPSQPPPHKLVARQKNIRSPIPPNRYGITALCAHLGSISQLSALSGRLPENYKICVRQK